MENAADSSPFHIGAAWTPEIWPEDQWQAEVARMKELGINCVRLFETAWHRFEPREWEFDFDWATRVLDMLKDAGIGAVIATPTAAPPAWMLSKYPEVLRVTPDGRRSASAPGRRYSVVSSRYREFCARIVDQMVHAFRGHEAIVGWQIDSQMSGADYGNEARRAFHAWLHDRFGEVESLNKTWGLEFASQAYEYFEQVPIPPVCDVGHGPLPHAARHHPSLMIAFQRFVNDQWSSFIQTQSEVLRSSFDKPLSTNMSPDWGMNYFRQNHLLDRVGMTLAVEDLSQALMHLDRMRAEKPGVPFWLLGTTTDGATVSPFSWLATLMGGELLLLDTWRQPWAGPDLSRAALVTPTGRWSAAKDAVARLVEQIKGQAEYLNTRPPVEARIGVVMSNESAWAFSIEPPEPDFEYEAVWRDEFYLPIARSHYWRDVIDQTADFCPYHVLIMPLLPMVYRPTRDRLKEWVTGGGSLLIGPLTGHRTEEYTAWTDHEFGGLEELMGATCTGSFIAADDTRILWGTDTPAAPPSESSQPGTPPADAATPAEPAKIPSSIPRGVCHAFAATTAHVLARYQGDRPATGQAAILMNKLGQGTVITLGARVDHETYLDLIHTLCDLAKIEPLATGSGDVMVIPRMKPDTTIAAYGVVNLTRQAQSITLPTPGTDRLSSAPTSGQVDLAPLEVKLIEIS